MFLITELSTDLAAKCHHYGDESEAFQLSCWLKCGDWRLALRPLGAQLSDSVATDVLVSYKRAIEAGQRSSSSSYRAFHSWALLNFRLAEQLSGNEKIRAGTSMANKSPTVIKSHVIVAVKGFVQAISVGTKRWSASVRFTFIVDSTWYKTSSGIDVPSLCSPEKSCGRTQSCGRKFDEFS